MTLPSEDLVDRNLERLFRRWADPLDETRTERARLAFLERATSGRPFPSDHRRWGLLATAAGLLICAAVYGSLFLAGTGGSQTPAQSDARIQALIDDLGHAEVAKRDRAAGQLASMGAPARRLLEQAVKGGNEGIRVRAQDVLDRMGAPREAAMLEVELEKQRALVQVLDAEALQKALRINDLLRQLEAAKTAIAKHEADHNVFVRQLEVQLAQIAELTKKLEELQKK